MRHSDIESVADIHALSYGVGHDDSAPNAISSEVGIDFRQRRLEAIRLLEYAVPQYLSMVATTADTGEVVAYFVGVDYALMDPNPRSSDPRAGPVQALVKDLTEQCHVVLTNNAPQARVLPGQVVHCGPGGVHKRFRTHKLSPLLANALEKIVCERGFVAYQLEAVGAASCTLWQRSGATVVAQADFTKHATFAAVPGAIAMAMLMWLTPDRKPVPIRIAPKANL
jgi:hypothetical protein